MDGELARALHEGRSLIVPTPQHATRLSLAWARMRLAAGDAVWASPDILTWDAWLAREWARGRDLLPEPARSARLLNRAQERALWTQVLARIGAHHDTTLTAHASALMRSAHRLNQSQLALPRGPATAEEQLLRDALQAVRAQCAARGLQSLALSGVSEAGALKVPAPLIAGVERLTPLQQRLGEALWPGTPLLATCDAGEGAAPVALQAANPHEEIRAAARWCLAQLREDPARRLLVVDATRGRNLRAVASEFWHALTAATTAELDLHREPRLLAVQGGESLMQHALVAQAIDALTLLHGRIETARLARIVRSPYFGWSDEDGARLDLALRDMGRAHWTQELLGTSLPGLAEPIARASDALAAHEPRRAGAWAQAFDQALKALGFPGNRPIDSRDAQRLLRWNELLDEFASLEVFGEELGFEQAWRELEQLARLGAHETASPDAAITLTADRSDPLVRHDGIWVLGLTEDNWPEPPRPDVFVPLALQRAAGWPEAGVELRRHEAELELAGWQRRAGALVLSHPLQVDGVHQRCSRLLRDLPWRESPRDGVAARAAPLVAGPVDELPPAAGAQDADQPLRAALRTLQLQQDCAFRAQAELRLAARALDAPVEGVDPRLRGQLLHAALEGLWRQLGSQAALQGLDAAARRECISRQWLAAEQLVLPRWVARPTPRVLARERRRAETVLEAVLDAELERDPFEVVALERRIPVQLGERRFDLRIDRIDRLEDGRLLVIDYKSGRAERIALEEGPLRPLQLALYATALAGAGEAPAALALQSLASADLRFAGVYDADTPGTAGLRPLAEWSLQSQRWRQQLLVLLEQFLQGNAHVAPLPGACRNCALPAFCRVGDIDAEPLDD